MAHRVVGTGQSITFAAAGTAVTSSSFKVQSNTVRLCAVGCAVNVAIGTEPVASTTDYYIPSGGTATTIVCPEGTQMPFVVGDRVTIQDSSDSNYDTKISNARVTSVLSSSGRDGYFQTRIVTNADTSGISTAFAAECHATLYKTASVSAIPNGGAAGSLWIQQVQVSGDA